MKKIILASLIAALTVCGAFAADNDYVPAGGVSSYTKTEYSVTSKFGQYYRSIVSKHVHVYDTTGLETETCEYNAKDVLLDKITYQYDTSRNLISLTYYGTSGEIIMKNNFEYESDGRIKSESEYSSDDKLNGKTIYEYSDNKTTESYYDGEGVLLEKVFTTKDSDDKVLEVVRYFGDGSLDQRSVYTYLDNGKVSKIETYGEGDVLSSKTVYVYDSNTGFINEVQTFDAAGTVVQRNQYKNDAKGNPTRINYWSVSEKFGGTVNELQSITEYLYKF